MTNVQWAKLVERLHRYKEVKVDGCILILWNDGLVSLRDAEDGHTINTAYNIDHFKPIFVDSEWQKQMMRLKQNYAR